jgi:Asp-tRNA(Asn)/Glu-tRNA(Gln) amidotransferase C subunit
MFTKKVTDSDTFIEMSSAAQALYFHLNQGADDDGFNNQIQIAMLKAHASTDDLKILMAKNFVIRFESGVIVIKHWRMHNTLRKDRYTPTNFQEELAQLGIKDNGAYTLGCQTVAKRLPQVSIDKESIDKESIDKESIVEDIMLDSDESKPSPKTKISRHKYGMYNNVLLSDEDMDKLRTEFPHDYTDRIERLSEYIASTGKSYKCHLATIRAWSRKDKATTKKQETSSNPFLEMLKNGEV